MFERFTERARRVVVLAQQEAQHLSHNYIGTEHLLLGLLGDTEGVAARALQSLDVSLDRVRERVREMIGEGKDPPRGHIPFTPRAKKVLELSLREALQLSHTYIGTEHILLGLVREAEGVAAIVLSEMAGDASTIRNKVLDLLSLETGAEESAQETPVESSDEPAGQGPPRGRESVPGAPARSDQLSCPRCRGPLEDHLAFRVLPARKDDDETDVRGVVVAYCTHCNTALGAWGGPEGLSA